MSSILIFEIFKFLHGYVKTGNQYLIQSTFLSELCDDFMSKLTWDIEHVGGVRLT